MRMDLGMLWYDDSKTKTLAQKVQGAVDYYQLKYGAAANVCFVHPAELAEPTWVGAVHVAPLGTVLAHHLFVGVADSAALPERPTARVAST